MSRSFSALMVMRMPCLLLALSVAPVACGQDHDPGNPVLVRVGTVDIRARDLQAQAAELARPFRAQLAAATSVMDQKIFLLNQMMKNEAVWQEAVRRGYDKRGGTREQIMDRFLQDEVESSSRSFELPDADIARYYVDHIDSLGQPGARPTLAEAAPGIRAMLKRLLVERKKAALVREITQKLQGEIDLVLLKEVAFPPGVLSQRR